MFLLGGGVDARGSSKEARLHAMDVGYCLEAADESQTLANLSRSEPSIASFESFRSRVSNPTMTPAHWGRPSW